MKFQSTHPHGVRLSRINSVADIKEFQSTHPHGVRRAVLLHRSNLCCFNPRTHTGCDNNSTEGQQEVDVSIHAPTRGATECTAKFIDKQVVSIHAPTRGATQQHEIFPVLGGVSIHAPTRGATLPRDYGKPQRQSFNPRTHTGCDNRNKAEYEKALFQSTHPHGVRPSICYHVATDSRFQSTHPHGVRLRYLIHNWDRLQFQSTHPHGVRHPNDKSAVCKECFNPRTHTGCDVALFMILLI